jgi:hypothetical protein
MPNKLQEIRVHDKPTVDSKSGESGFSGKGKGKIIREEERIEVRFEHIVRIHARDFEAIKRSFEEWAEEWE